MIDVEHLCPGCMGRWEDTRKPCPRCGFIWGQEDKGGLPPFSVLAGKYLLGVKIGTGRRKEVKAPFSLPRELHPGSRCGRKFKKIRL